MHGWKRGENRTRDIPPQPCQVRSNRGKTCGRTHYAWTNHMQGLCKDHHIQRRVIQNLLIKMSGRGSWGGVIGAYTYEEQFMTPNEIRAKYGFPPIEED